MEIKPTNLAGGPKSPKVRAVFFLNCWMFWNVWIFWNVLNVWVCLVFCFVVNFIGMGAASFINASDHKRDANVDTVVKYAPVRGDGPAVPVLVFRATRNIKKGEMLLYHYDWRDHDSKDIMSALGFNTADSDHCNDFHLRHFGRPWPRYPESDDSDCSD